MGGNLGRSHSSQDGSFAALWLGPRHALDYNPVLSCAAGHRRGSSDLSPALLLGRNRQHIHYAPVQNPNTVLKVIGTHRLYGYVLHDQNGWSRYLHFQAAWLAVLTGLVYIISSFFSGHLRRALLPSRADRSWRSFSTAIANHLRFQRPGEEEALSYNPLQRLTYLVVIFVLFPLVVWTGLAMSPAIASVFPGAVSVLGGQQSARTIHFFVSVFLLFFLLVHIVMICLAGFRKRMRAMITGHSDTNKEHA